MQHSCSLDFIFCLASWICLIWKKKLVGFVLNYTCWAELYVLPGTVYTSNFKINSLYIKAVIIVLVQLLVGDNKSSVMNTCLFFDQIFFPNIHVQFQGGKALVLVFPSHETIWIYITIHVQMSPLTYVLDSNKSIIMVA